MAKPTQNFKQTIMHQSAINEVKQTLETFAVLDAQFKQLAELDLNKLHIQYLHLMQLSEDIDDPNFKKSLERFADNVLDTKLLYLNQLLGLSRKTSVVNQDIVSELESFTNNHGKEKEQ
ncbi:hypothetical protein [Leuconostoc pseudomesenteroides]|uniref:hypothetical protein n=1 Tax=Leuconostoc pseudomesenteroides TaxID=33968 RepID=UPI0032DECD2E